MANVERLPLVLVVTNNQFAYSTPNIREFGEASLADRGAAATDSPCMKRTARTSWPRWKPSGPPSITRGKARGPQWVLAKTLRMCGHGEHDDASYIPRELKEEYEKKTPSPSRNGNCWKPAG